MRNLRLALLGFAALLLPAAGGADSLPERIGRVLTISARPFTPGLLLGTTEGLYRRSPNGTIVQVPRVKGPIIRLVRDPARANRLLAASGEGVIHSEDNGSTWALSTAFGWPEGALPVIALSPGDDKTLWRATGVLERSDDGGRSWQGDGVVPRQVFALLLTTDRSPSLYAATRGGLLQRREGASEWTPAHPAEAPATVVALLPDRHLYTFIVGQGLLRKDGSDWKPVSNPFGGQFPVNLVSDGARLYALTNAGKILQSGDGGATWQPLGGEPELASAAERQGRSLYQDHCQECHGPLGMGETLVWGPSDTTPAPALDDSAHAWHHTDEQLVATILDGSPNNTRMEGWKDRLSAAQAQSIVAYIKTLWGSRTLECQGPKHMQCM